MPPRIHLGVNLNFAKYVYGRRRALDIVREVFGLHHVEMVPDIDFGPAFYLRSPGAFRAHHREVGEHARRIGVSIVGILTFYRDNVAIAHPDPEIRRSAETVMESEAEQAACYEARFCSASFAAMHREDYENPERRGRLFREATDAWKRWMMACRSSGIERVLIETAGALREGCSTIEQTRRTLAELDRAYEADPGRYAPVGLCYDTGHGVSPEEGDDRERDFRAWFSAFPDRINEIHLKDTDPEFLSTWPFTGPGKGRGIIALVEVIRAVREMLTVPEVYLFLETPGKRGRSVGEDRAIEDHRISILAIQEALRLNGYRQERPDAAWLAGA